MISIIIPTLDEETALPGTLNAVFAQPGEYEVIVADGGSTDATRKVATRHDGVQFLVADRGRARQMNAGAEVARGDWLLFLHADTLLPKNALSLIEVLPTGTGAGCFHHRFSGSSGRLRLLSWLHNQRFRLTKVIYGDQALFIRRRLFHELGGFPDRPMEDIAFSLTMRSATRPVMLPEYVVTDSRKFDQMGHWRALTGAIILLIRFRLGSDVSNDRFFGSYR